MSEESRFKPGDGYSEEKLDSLVKEAKMAEFLASLDVREAAVRLKLDPQRVGESDLDFAYRVQPELDKESLKRAKDMGIETEGKSMISISQEMLDMQTINDAKDMGIETEGKDMNLISQEVLNKNPDYFKKSRKI